MADEDFQQQLELEKLEQEKKERVAAGTDPYTYVDPSDGSVFEWDHAKKAWFPKVDDDFIAKYQENYSYQEPEVEPKKEDDAAEKATKGEKRKASDPCWFQVDDDRNTNVYVSGLPSDITEEEFVELMGKCGMVMKDPDSMKYKIKLYRDKDGTVKGDGRCCYIKIESVKLALDILDGYLFKGKHSIHVERAQFELKGQYDPTKKPKKKKSKDKEKLKKKLDKLFDWRPDKLRGQRSKNENTVIIKNMFEPKEFDQDATLLLDYQNDIREECSKCGEVKKVVIYDRNPEGVVGVTFTEPEMADECINLMNNRWFASRQLTAETWDGKTRYKVFETEEELQKRLDNWDKYLDEKDDQEAAAKLAAAAASCSQPGIDSGAATSSSSQPCTNSGADSSSQQDKTSDSDSASHDSQPPGVEKLNVPSSAYELAGDTDSSGDSGDEEGR